MTTKQALSMLRRGDLGAAEEAYRRALARDPDCHEALHGLGLVLHQRGRDGQAVAMIERARDLRPQRADYHYHLAEVLRTAGRHEQAIAEYRAAIELVDARADHFFGLGNALAETGADAEAVDAYRRAAELAPADAEIRNNLGNALADTGDVEGALQHLHAAVALSSGYADAHHNLALVLKASGDVEQALTHARRAHELAPKRAEPLINLGQLLERSAGAASAVHCYREAARRAGADPVLLKTIGDCLRNAGDPRAAADACRRAIALEPSVATHRVGLCQCLIQLHRFSEAESESRKACEIDPGHAPALATLAVCLQTRGQFDEATALLRRALELDPLLGVAAYLLAAGGDDEIDDGALERWRAHADDPALSREKRYHLHFAVARVHDRRGEHDAAFGHFREANRIKASLFPFDARRHSDYVERIRAVFTREFFEQRGGHGLADDRLVFIVGMPRSGSTLVEQILSSHPYVAALGEHPEMREIVRELPEIVGTGATVPECCRELSARMAGELAERYLASMPATVAGAARVTDKMLGNFLRLGIIALLFPRARIVHCVRDPLDTCLSCFTQNFSQGLRFTTDLSNLASFYRDYRRLMAHWHRVLPLPVMDVRYESLVHDPETFSRSLVEFCGLPWDERCLSPQRTRREIATASLWQARQPVYTGSVGRWRHYEAHLGPLVDGLREEGAADVA